MSRRYNTEEPELVDKDQRGLKSSGGLVGSEFSPVSRNPVQDGGVVVRVYWTPSRSIEGNRLSMYLFVKKKEKISLTQR